MGCDIHWHSETKRADNWTCDQAESFADEDDGDGGTYADMNDLEGRGRDYWFFGLLNNVRTQWPWSFQNGTDSIPEDASKEVRTVHARWEGDAHSAGSLTRAELKAKLAELKLLRAQELVAPRSSTTTSSAWKK